MPASAIPTSSSGRAPVARAMRKNSHAPRAQTIARSAASGAPPASTIQSARGAATMEKRKRFASSLMRAGGCCSSPASDFPDLRLFGLDHLIDLSDVVVVDLLQILLGVFHVVFAHAAELLQAVARMRPRMANGDLAIFGELVDDLHEILAPLLVHRRQRDADHSALRRR